MPSEEPNRQVEHAAALPQSSPAQAQKPAQNAADFFSPPESADKTTRGSAIFWGCFILGFPIIFAALALIIALFGLCYIALIGAIIGFVLALIAIVAVGGGGAPPRPPPADGTHGGRARTKPLMGPLRAM